MANQLPTINDVAKLAETSATTVSHVINETRFVSPDTKQRVMDAIRALGYRPNSMARGLRSGQSKTIGLIVPDNSNPFFAEILRIIENYGYSKGYSVILCNSDGDVNKEIAYTELLYAKQVDGIVFISTNNSTEHLEKLTDSGIPMIVMDRDVDLTDTDVIMVDNYQGGYAATQYLIQLGHQRIACIAGPSLLTPSADRVKGYRQALEDAGLPYDESLVVSGDFQVDSGESAMRVLLEGKHRPTAVFACNDLMALGAMRAIREAGLSIPQDISVIGFDDIALSSYISPTLTTIAQPLKEMARASIEMLITRIQGETVDLQAKRRVLPTELIIRESCMKIGED